MATSFKREVKMKTTEPSVDEVGKGMKRGGHAMKKADGGMSMMSPPAPALTRQRPMVRRPTTPIMRKEGGETKAMHKAEMKKMSKVEHELKSHESKPASKAHRGLKNGGMSPKAGPDVVGGLAGGLEATRPVTKKGTGGVRSPGYKKGGNVGPYINTKVVDDASGHHRAKKTSGGVEGVGYKKGGSIAAYANTKMHDAAKGNAVKKKGTGSLELSKFKDGGHVSMGCHAVGGFMAKKKMSKC
jgi:hypothetical protein